MMGLLNTILSFIASHWQDFVGTLTTAKLGADTIDSIKKVLPEKLEAKQITQTYLEESVALLNKKDIPIEDKKWELQTRKSLVKSMVHLTAIEASYNIARVTVIAAFFTIVLRLTARIITHRKEF